MLIPPPRGRLHPSLPRPGVGGCTHLLSPPGGGRLHSSGVENGPRWRRTNFLPVCPSHLPESKWEAQLRAEGAGPAPGRWRHLHTAGAAPGRRLVATRGVRREALFAEGGNTHAGVHEAVHKHTEVHKEPRVCTRARSPPHAWASRAHARLRPHTAAGDADADPTGLQSGQGRRESFHDREACTGPPQQRHPCVPSPTRGAQTLRILYNLAAVLTVHTG